jgi:hypothetical protein
MLPSGKRSVGYATLGLLSNIFSLMWLGRNRFPVSYDQNSAEVLTST